MNWDQQRTYEAWSTGGPTVAQMQQQAMMQAAMNWAVLGNAIPSFLRGLRTVEPPKPVELAPTRFGEIIGWRLWKINGGYLESLSANVIWVPREVMSGGPSDDNYMGVHSFREKQRAMNEFLEDDNIVLGSVECWGLIYEHEDGYRTEFARLRSLDHIYPLDADSARLLRQLRKTYGVGGAK